MKVQILYHSADWDGWCSAWLVHRALTTKKLDLDQESIRFVPYNYGWHLSQSEIGKNDWVFMVDMSLPVDEMHRLRDKVGNKFVWIDHHEKIITEVAGSVLESIDGIRAFSENREENFSACELTFLWLCERGCFFPGENEQDTNLGAFVSLLGEYDTFRTAEDKERWIKVLRSQYALKTVIGDPNESLAFWDQLLETCKDTSKFREFVQLITSEDSQYADILNVMLAFYKSQLHGNSFDARFNGTLGLFCNRPALAGSTGFRSIEDKMAYDFVCDYTWNQKKGIWKFHFYVPRGKKTNLIQVFKGLPYGGHRGAGGMEVLTWRVTPQGFLELECASE